MAAFQKLHLANNLDALDLLVHRDCDVRKIKFHKLCSALTTLYKASQQNVLDQEITYILLARYLNVYNFLKNSQTDKKFVKVRFGSESEKVQMQFNEIKRSLEERYAALQPKIVAAPPDEEMKEVPVEVKPKCIFNEEFVTCQQLFSALKTNHNMLLVDARPDTDFEESRIDHPNCINVPDHCITAGLSANILGKRLNEETKKFWDKRDKYDVIVLYDWNTSSDNFASTKLHKLRSALVNWDLNRNYNEPPVILNGGYLELLQMYPTICINPRVYLFQKNNELDELLELDNIKYPTESDNKIQVMGIPEAENLPPNEGPAELSKQALIHENKELALSLHNTILLLQQQENEKRRLNDICNTENNINNIANLKKRVSDIDVEIIQNQTMLEDVLKRKDDVKKRFKFYFNEELEEDIRPEEIKEMDITEEDDEKLKDIIVEERKKELQKARALKPKKPQSNTSINDESQEISTPKVNRDNKPTFQSYSARPLVEKLKHTTAGLVGLRNIRNTCYMNTVIQCMRNIPAIKHLFCDGAYSNTPKYNIRVPAAIIHETAALIRQLWTRSVKSMEPNDFYAKICQLEPNYRVGHHEDCMEFFLFLLNHLCEDCCYDINVPKILTPRQKAWYNQFEGNNSVFIDLFYHQIRITQMCNRCEQKPTYKFEIESTFMLSVPDTDFTIEQLLEDYLSDYVIADYCCANCKKPVKNKKELCYGPKIMVIILKRYRQIHVHGKVTLRKVEARAHFPQDKFRLCNCLYQLNAIALHTGDMNYGHYTAAALTPNGWYEFNDEAVRPININDDSLKVKACAFFYSMCDE